MAPLISEAIQWWQNGYTPLPVKPDGSKAPAVKTWTQYQKQRPTLPETLELFKTDSDGIGLICGAISGGLEMLELEGRAVEEGFEDKLSAALHAHNLDDLWIRVCNGYVELTPKGGVHYYYRVEGHPKRNTKLAQRPATPDELEEKPDEKKKTLIETRAEGGFTVIAPSGGRTHTDGVYKVLVGGIQGIPWVTEDERDAIHAIASTLDQMPVLEPPPPRSSHLTVAGELRPGDHFNQQATWQQILEPHGWTIHKHYGGNLYGWRKPNKQHPGISATTGRNDADRLYVFSTSTLFEPEKPYSKFGAFTLLEHGGDYSAAAKALRIAGYGAQNDPKDAAAVKPPHPVTNGDTTSTVETNGTEQPTRRLKAVQASTITMKATRWIYEDEQGKWIPLGAFVLLGGREGVGKSTVAYDLIGKITRGELPGHLYGIPKSVIVCATEDAWEETIIPRLVAAGANLEKVWRVNAVTPEGFDGSLSLPEDTERLRQIIVEQDVALVLLDPLMTTINVKLDSHKDAEVRQALEPIVDIAHQTKVSVIGLIHENKTGASDLLNRIMGSKAFTAVVRGVLYACRENKDDELDDFLEAVDPDPGPDHFLFGQLKNNLGPRVRISMRYHISGEQVGYDNELNLPIWSSKIVWDDINQTHIQDVVTAQERPGGGRITEGDKIARWLRKQLVGKGEVPSDQIIREAEDEGFVRSTVHKARKEKTGIVVTNIHGTSKTTWKWPTTHVDT